MRELCRLSATVASCLPISGRPLLRQVEAQLADVRGQIDQDVRNALLDLKSSSDQVEVAQSSVMGDENVIAAILNGMRTLDARPVESELRGVR